MRTLIISSLLLVAGACDRDTARDGANTARDRVAGPTDLSTVGQPVAPSGTFGTGDSSERPAGQPGTADRGAGRQTTGFVTTGPMGTGGPNYTTGTTGVAGNQGIPSTMPNPDVGRTDTKDLDKSMGPSHHADDGKAAATARVQSTDVGQPRALNEMTGHANAGTGSTAVLGEAGPPPAKTVTAQRTTRKKTTGSQQR